MQTYISIIIEFFKTGLFAVGGGLATIPFLKAVSENYGWFTAEQLTDMIAVSESTPGPIGINMATYAGWNAAGFLGSVTATLSLVAPSVIVIAVISRFLNKFRDSRLVKGAFYALRPAGAGLIAGAMFPVLLTAAVAPLFPQLFGYRNGDMNAVPAAVYIVFTVVCFITDKSKKPPHPVIFIAAGALLGILFGFLGIEL